jgi:dolichyl-phosphate beta-glucosyltransferase
MRPAAEVGLPTLRAPGILDGGIFGVAFACARGDDVMAPPIAPRRRLLYAASPAYENAGSFMPAVSIVIPTLHEPDLRPLLGEIARVAAPLGGYEVLIVDDSGDAAHEALARSLAAYPEVRVLRGAHRGKGAAVRDGLLAAAGDVVFFIDADLAPAVPLLPALYGRIARGGADVVIAERENDWRGRPFFRVVLSYGLYLAQRLLVLNTFRFADTQCGFKAFTRDAAHSLARRQRVLGGMADIEYLYMAMRDGLRIEQVPLGRIVEARPSRINVLRCLRTDPVALLGIKLRGLFSRDGSKGGAR